MPHLPESVREANRTIIRWSTCRNLLRSNDVSASSLPQGFFSSARAFIRSQPTTIALTGAVAVVAVAVMAFFYYEGTVLTMNVQTARTQAAKEQVAWVTVANSVTPAPFEAFLEQFPNGNFSDDARAKLQDLKTKQQTLVVVPQPNLSNSRFDLGMRLSSITPELKKQFHIDSSQKGVIVTGVVWGGPAASGGLIPGDIIASVEMIDVSSPEQVMEKIAEQLTRNRSSVLMYIQRGSGFLNVELALGSVTNRR
jgi:hypothetical protein